MLIALIIGAVIGYLFARSQNKPAPVVRDYRPEYEQLQRDFEQYQIKAKELVDKAAQQVAIMEGILQERDKQDEIKLKAFHDMSQIVTDAVEVAKNSTHGERYYDLLARYEKLLALLN
ncbi:hypothetical protein IC229_33150 [Spirosoma sp. BT702]|uniref:Uncharacterized protein n=1 Tax=Spirosoma profusum TaxID=2771354 RepID=A0A927AW80_9BACT|nr:hypothetical protein [Spirosoma profusum]MBD2705506.1 hypothetical protein [Spirosoma profusum]